MRLLARLLDSFAQFFLVIFAWILWADGDRLVATLFLAFLVIWAYEALFSIWLGATPAKRLLGMHLVVLDHKGRPTPQAAARRGAAAAALTTIPVIGWSVWAVSTLGDPLGRGLVDRVAHTMVVPDHFVAPVATRHLPGFADGVRAPRLVAQGRVADLDVRIRARLRRLTGSPVLVGAVAVLTLGVALPFTTAWAVLASSVAWVVLFIVDETLEVRRTGTTPGHQIAGLVIVDRRRGTAPRTARSAARALVLGLTLYVPVLWPILALSMLLMRYSGSGRGLHDFAGATVVIADPTLDPEDQRQRSMRMRTGQAG